MTGFHVTGPSREGEWLAWDVVVDPGWKAFAGHFPGRPILPAIGHLFIVRHLLESVRGPGTRITAVDRFRITRPIPPGAKLRVRIEIREAQGSSHFTIDDGAERSSAASFQWT